MHSFPWKRTYFEEKFKLYAHHPVCALRHSSHALAAREIQYMIYIISIYNVMIISKHKIHISVPRSEIDAEVAIHTVTQAIELPGKILYDS